MKRPISHLVLGWLALIGTHSAFAQPFTQADTKRISVASGTGTPFPDADVINPRMSKNGRFVVFESTASNLVTASQLISPITFNGKRQIYLYDRQSDSLELISVTGGFIPEGGQPSPVDCYEPAVSNDGRYVFFVMDLSGPTGRDTWLQFNTDIGIYENHQLNKFYPGKHVVARDRLTNAHFLVSQVSMPVTRQALDPKTKQRQFTCECLPGFTGCDTTKYIAGQNKCKPVSEVVTLNIAYAIKKPTSPFYDEADTRRPSSSGDGRFVVMDSTGNNGGGPRVTEFLLPVEGVDYNQGGVLDGMVDGVDQILGNDDDIIDNRWPEDYIDFNNVRDVFVRDGKQYSSQVINIDGLYHIDSPSSNLNLDLVSKQQRDSYNGSISDDGNVIAFESLTPWLALDFNFASDVFLMKRDDISKDAQYLDRISNNYSRILAPNGASANPRVSSDGRYVVYQSAASNIVFDDTNAKSDVFLYDRDFFTTIRCFAADGSQANGDSALPEVSGAGESVVFQSSATNWGATGGNTNIYVGTLQKDSSGRVSSCKVELASTGSGTGGNGNSTQASVARVPRTIVKDGVEVRVATSAVTYRSAATNLTTGADTNAKLDIFQAPICTARDVGTDTDGDGTSDCFDQCWKDPKKVEDVDGDGDGVADCEDGCAQDPQKLAPGICGCSVVDSDSDQDGALDCKDGCPADPLKDRPGKCGCGIPDADANGNGTVDCLESVVPTPTPNLTPPTPVPSTPTPAFTAEPTVGVFNQVVPRAAVVKRAGPGVFEVTLSSAGFPEAAAAYRVRVYRAADGVVVGAVRRTTNLKLVVRNLKAGRYFVRYSAVSAAKVETRLSKASKVFIAR
jgi:Tol biopolymer transport system component